MENKYRKKVQKLLKSAGITINGNNPWDIQVHNEEFYKRVIIKGALGLGESYMDEWWEAKAIDQTMDRILRAKLDYIKDIGWRDTLFILAVSTLTNMQRESKAHKIGEAHYDKGNDLFSLMLDKRMNYSCGYWKDAKNLDEAQENKLELICQKIGLKKGMTVLDIGCGWGGFVKYAAEKYWVKTVGITVSKEQERYAKESTKNLPVEIRFLDYRKLDEKFDRIVSIGMIEHVGKDNYREFMEIANRNLEDDGLFLLHTIGTSVSSTAADPWTNKYIFPGGMLPSIKQLGESIEGLFIMEDWHNFGADYDKTLMVWYKNFSSNWEKIKDQYDKRFKRMWSFYLLSFAGAFRSRRNQLWQIVLSKNGIKNGYQRIS